MKSRVSRSEQLALEFKRRIAMGIYPANSFLPPERELAKEFDTSRDTVAAALAVLAEEGLVERQRGRGTRIIQWPESQAQAVGCIVGGPFRTNWPESLRMFEGVRDTLSRLGYKYELIGTEAAFSPNCGNWPPIGADEILARFQGVLYVESTHRDEQILDLHRQGFPLVVANLEIDLDVPCTWANHKETTRDVVKILAGFGHKRIAYLGRGRDAYFYGKSIDGYCLGLEEVGIDCDESLIGTVDASSPLLAYLKTRELLSLPNPPTAIAAARDLFAEGACQAAHEAGLVVGRDLSIIGYDDISWPQEEPFLTTFREPCHEMGAAAAQILVERMLGNSRDIVRQEVGSSLIIRRSAGPLF